MRGEYTAGELRLAVAQERAALVAERIAVVGRIRADSSCLDEIDKRLDELRKADNLLEGEL